MHQPAAEHVNAASVMPAAPTQAPSAADAKHFDHQVAGSDAANVGTVQMHHSVNKPHGIEEVVTHLRTETAALDAKFDKTFSQGVHATSFIDSSDPMMSMVRMADFSYSATTMLMQYQFSLNIADASTGTTKSLIKNDVG
ncbi:hypothetical protein C0Z18_18250 [Trinickia dabaoshanensis]|uniref:Uncharacterized protein n=1 Tax=Trinickia dabaoshanensis TaxID=564714 RepID=A0A2N7VM02_9BURK|nr:hypothetical protein C0Z18_18250 [Trinickia dabaoshanensis]